MYLKLAGVALAGLLAYFLVARQGRSKALESKIRTLQHRQRIYRETDADTARQEAALEVKIEATAALAWLRDNTDERLKALMSWRQETRLLGLDAHGHLFTAGGLAIKRLNELWANVLRTGT